MDVTIVLDVRTRKTQVPLVRAGAEGGMRVTDWLVVGRSDTGGGKRRRE